MQIVYAPRFKRELKKIPKNIRSRFYKQLEFLQSDLNHPSLRAKKYDRRHGVWQARVNGGYRFYFRFREERLELVSIIRHP